MAFASSPRPSSPIAFPDRLTTLRLGHRPERSSLANSSTPESPIRLSRRLRCLKVEGSARDKHSAPPSPIKLSRMFSMSRLLQPGKMSTSSSTSLSLHSSPWYKSSVASAVVSSKTSAYFRLQKSLSCAGLVKIFCSRISLKTSGVTGGLKPLTHARCMPLHDSAVHSAFSWLDANFPKSYTPVYPETRNCEMSPLTRLSNVGQPRS
mmetsp:Transcript_18657/g.52702  ORF Transcript_18657/g.52702 Transcript_18657/m.52702 type:complete len:207 (-) Transcript_18657:480-1100(-)